MKVLHVIPGLGRSGGAERSLVHTARCLADRSFELHVAVLSDRMELRDELESNGAWVHDLSDPRGALAKGLALRTVARTIEPDVVHSTLFEADVLTSLALGRSLPRVTTWASTPYQPESALMSERPRWKSKLVQTSEMAIGRWSNSYFQAVTPGVAASNQRALRVDSSRVFLSERGRPEVPPLSAGQRQKVRDNLGLSPTAFVVLSIARHERHKDLTTMLHGFAQFYRSRPDGRLLVAGRVGEETEVLHQLIDSLDLRDVVHLLGSRPDVNDLIAIADAFASTSITEGAAGGVIEAMAGALPIVSTDVAGLDGVLAAGQNAEVIALGEADELAAALSAFAEDPRHAAELAEAARETFLRRFTVERSAETLAALYESVYRLERQRD